MSREKLPIALPGGHLVPHMSARRRSEVVDTVFEQVGGVEKMVAWVEKSDDNYGAFVTKVWAKGMLKNVSTEHHLGGGVEDLLDQLDRAEKATVIDGTLVEPETEAS